MTRTLIHPIPRKRSRFALNASTGSPDALQQRMHSPTGFRSIYFMMRARVFFTKSERSALLTT